MYKYNNFDPSSSNNFGYKRNFDNLKDFYSSNIGKVEYRQPNTNSINNNNYYNYNNVNSTQNNLYRVSPVNKVNTFSNQKIEDSYDPYQNKRSYSANPYNKQSTKVSAQIKNNSSFGTINNYSNNENLKIQPSAYVKGVPNNRDVSSLFTSQKINLIRTETIKSPSINLKLANNNPIKLQQRSSSN